MIAFAPVVFGSVAGLKDHRDVFVHGPLEPGVGKVHQLMSKIIAVMPFRMYGWESPVQVEIKAGDDLGNHRIGKECIGVEVGAKTGFLAGPSVGEKEIAGANFDLLDFLVAVLDREDVVGIGLDCGAGKRFIFDIRLDDMFISFKLSLAM